MFLMLLSLLVFPVEAGGDYIRWVDFDVSYAALQRALDLDIASRDTEQPVSWIDLLALSAAWSGGGKFQPKTVDKALAALTAGRSLEEQLGAQYRCFAYYQEAYGAVLGGLVGAYAIATTDEYGNQVWTPAYGLKAFSPIAEGYWYNHYDDFGAGRSYGFRRRHLGNDLMGSLGTPIVAVESGTVEALGWNQYGGWRIGIRSDDARRYYYYAHLRKDEPYVKGLQEGSRVEAGQVIGFMGRTGYSTKENTNNIETVHLHFGLQLIFDESQKECDSEIWVDVYNLVRLLSRHRSSVWKNPATGLWERVYPYRDLDAG
ncbi:MAG: M23 family metallopeptidase [Oscillospiraceae bacterium]|nr:M23 family metallopeptidase [Oscillospiraceae bacterium]